MQKYKNAIHVARIRSYCISLLVHFDENELYLSLIKGACRYVNVDQSSQTYICITRNNNLHK